MDTNIQSTAQVRPKTKNKVKRIFLPAVGQYQNLMLRQQIIERLIRNIIKISIGIDTKNITSVHFKIRILVLNKSQVEANS